MRFAELLKRRAVLAEGAVVERLRRDARVRLDPHLAHAAFVYRPVEAGALAEIYREYLGIAAEASLPILLFSPTWRANPERLRAAGLADRNVNHAGVNFVRWLASAYPGPALVGGLVGCRGDCYKPEEGLTEKDAVKFHGEQAHALASAQPDFLFGATLPALPEAAGLARALADERLPYALSFVLGSDGALLDGTPLAEAVRRIDADIAPAPAGYFVNCVHASTLAATLGREPLERLVGFQGNTSKKSPAERDGLAELDTEEPEEYARAALDLHRRFGIRVLGGCCGTDGGHIRALAAGLVRE